MTKFSLSKIVSAAATSAAFLGGSAHAGVWQGTWDPFFGSPFLDASNQPDLYFQGSATFNTGTCNTDGTWTFAQCGGLMSITNVTMTLSDGPLNPSSTSQQVFTMSYASMPVQSMRIQGGNLVAVNAEFYTPTGVQANLGVTQLVNPYTNPVSTYQPYFGISFSDQLNTTTFGFQGYAQLGFKFNESVAWSCTADSATVGAGFCGAQRAEVTFTPAIPEPSTYALMAAGLAAVGFVARRRQSAKAKA